MLRLTKYLLVFTALLGISLPVVLLVSGLQAEALVPLGDKLTPADIARARALIRQYDPRTHRPGQVRSLALPERDLAVVIDYMVRQRLPASADVDLQQGGASVLLTVEVPENPFGRFFNVRLDLAQVPGGIDVAGLRVGSLQMPAVITRGIRWLVDEVLRSDPTIRAVLASVNSYQLTEDRLELLYQWQPDLVDQVTSAGRTLLIDKADRDRLLAYAARIAAVTQKGSVAGKLPVTDLLGPVFEEARRRTGTHGHAAAENRAAIVALMLYVQRVDVARLLGEPPQPRYRSKARPLTLRGRVDLAQHFLISAGIAAGGGSRLADAVGLFKELDDSRKGSGFSFTDLTADRAGVRFAEVATGSAAERLQGLMAEQPTESLFMPEVRDLAEFMPEDEFLRRYGGVGAARYREVEAEIEERISALAIHQRLR